MAKRKDDKRNGNQFWKQRSSHGRDLLFASPSLLWEAACEYFDWCANNPMHKQEAIKSGDLAGTTMSIPTDRPFTMHGLCLYLDCSTSYFRAFKSTATEDKKDFLTVIEKIEEVVYQQQFEGATVGAYNANIIARTLGLTEKQETKHTIRIGKDLEDEVYD
ncbi:MAG: DNA packaging protein [Chryseobacterium sp.]|nr:MAG: DNA packaging protein [Chryseobacterium sp.]